MAEIEVRAECSSCGGTGLYVGFVEPRGTAVVCQTCNGTGCQIIHCKSFEGRKGKRGVKWVQRKSQLTGRISYADFEKGKMP